LGENWPGPGGHNTWPASQVTWLGGHQIPPLFLYFLALLHFFPCKTISVEILLYSNMNRPASKCVDVFVCCCDVILWQLTSRGSLLDRSLRAVMVTRQARVQGLDSATHRLNQQLGPSWQLGDRLGQAHQI
jgi:hypothetical protein